MSHWRLRREDYALEVVPQAFRQWHWYSLLGVMLSGSSAMFCLTFGGQLVQRFGTLNLILAMVIATLFVGAVAFVLVSLAARVGLNMDLISSVCGMGYKGAGFTSLIYSVAFIVFFAVEGNIIASATQSFMPTVAPWLVDIVVGLIFIPLTWFGMSSINYIAWISLPVYLILLLCWIIHVANMPAVAFLHYHPVVSHVSYAGPLILQLLAPTLATLSAASLGADIGRFVPKKNRLLTIFGLSFITNAVSYLVAVLLGAWFTLKIHSTNPGAYLPQYMGGWGVLMVIISQLRINMLNTYSGSLALSTCMSRLFNVRPGRHISLLILVIAATLMMFANLLAHLTTVFSFLSIFLVAWIMAVTSFVLFNKVWLRARKETFRYQRGELMNYNKIGLIPLFAGIIVGVLLNMSGAVGATYAPFASGVIAFVLVPVLQKYRK